MLCLKVANNAQSCQSLYDFIQLSLYKTSREPNLVLNKKKLPNKQSVTFKKSKICLDCKLYLNLEIVGHRSSSRKCAVYYKHWRLPSWDCWKKIFN